MPSLEIDNVKKSYDNFQALKGVSFRAEAGEFVVMVGPSGCGKSTLLRSIAGLETISSGAIRIDGRDIAHDDPSQRGVAMVFQNYALYPHMSVAQNMGFALKMAGRPKAEIDAAVQRAAQILRITEHLEKRPKALSGGQKQRVAIGRAITRSPDVFLFDEPLSNLDAALRSQMRIELGRLHAELKATMVYVTHDQTEAMTMASRIVVLNAGQIEQTGSPLELYNRPANRFVAGFLGTPRMNFFAGRVVRKDGSAVAVQLPGVDLNLDLVLEGDGPGVGEQIVLGARPEALDGETGIEIKGTMAVVENLGREALVYVDAGPLRTFDSESQEGYLAVHRPFQVESRIDAPTSIRIDARRLYAFGADGRTIAFPQSF